MSSLIVRLPNHLGDACMTLPALRRLSAHGTRLLLVGKGWAASLFAAYDWPATALPSGLRTRVRALRELRARTAADTQGLLFTNSFSSALEFRLAGIATTGYARDARGWLLARAVPPSTTMHMVEYYDALARTLTGDNAAVPSELALDVGAGARAKAQALLGAAGVTGDYVVLCPVAVGLHRGKVKAWSGFTRLCTELRTRGVRVVACPGPGERAAVTQALPGATILPEADVGTFAALLAGSRLVVANDSGSGHVAAAVGVPLVSVFGVTDPTQTRPWGSRVRLVGGSAGWPNYREVLAAVEAALAA
jgi:heptosyltransferase-2